MSQALWLLLRLRYRAALRRRLRGVTTVRGAALFVLGAGVLALWIGPSFMMSLRQTPSDPANVAAVFPFMIFVFLFTQILTSAGERAIYFSPGETELLFTGPFTRRGLLLYKLVGSLGEHGFLALFFSLLFLRHATRWPAAFIGCLLTLLFIQLGAMALFLTGQLLVARLRKHIRTVAALLLALLGVGAAMGVRQGGGTGAAFGSFIAWLHSPAMRAILAPLSPFGRAFTAATLWPDLVIWGGLALCINATLAAIVLMLDVNYLEAADAVSRRLYERLQRVRKAGPGAVSGRKESRRSLPMPPYLGGIGPLAWRQAIQISRATSVFISIAVMLVVMAVVVGVAGAQRGQDAHGLRAMIVMMMIWATVMISTMLRGGFPGDADRIELLKTLPVRPYAMALGQIAATALVLTAIHAVLLAALAYAQGTPALLVVGVAIAFPANLLLAGIDNWVFLIWPVRPVMGVGDFHSMGRQILVLFIKMALMGLGGGVAAGVAFGVFFLTRATLPALFAAAAVLLAFALAMALPTARAFTRFDVGQVPPE